jgi:hypothetical protein
MTPSPQQTASGITPNYSGPVSQETAFYVPVLFEATGPYGIPYWAYAVGGLLLLWMLIPKGGKR